MSQIRNAAFMFVALVACAGCEIQRGSTTTPTPVTSESTASATSYVGVWASQAAAGATDPSKACSSFEWNITTQTPTSIAGSFSATCLGNVVITGTASGVFNGQTIEIAVGGTANISGVQCTFALTSTGAIEGDAIRLPYSGTTCLGPVSGTETLRRNQPSSPAPPAPPAPEPTPDPPPAPEPPPPPAVPCASNDGEAIVSCIEDMFPDRRVGGISLGERQNNMAWLRDRVIEAGICGGLDLAWNKKRGDGPHSIDALAWRLPNGKVEVVDIGAAYDDTDRELRLMWSIVEGPPGYDWYSPRPNCGGN